MNNPKAPGQSFPAIIKRITTTDEGRVQIVIDAQTDNVEIVKAVLDMQREGVIVQFMPILGGLFDEISPAEAPSRAR